MAMRMSGSIALPLVDEHPELVGAATALTRSLATMDGALGSIDGASAWLHHTEYATRAGDLADHLESVIQLAASDRYASAFALLRTALEHSCVDELLLLADRYRDEVKADDASCTALEAEYQAGASWASNVVVFQRTKRGVALIRVGHDVKNDDGEVVEQLSPYYPVVNDHDAILGPPDAQADLAEAFSDPDQLRAWARQNRGLYDRYLRWSAIVDNLVLNGRLSDSDAIRIQVHYRYLSAFTHATGTGYKAINRQRGHPGFGRRADHLLGELVLLYVCAVALTELRSFQEFVDRRPRLRIENRDELDALVRGAESTTAYFWFPRLGAPTGFDFFDEANRRAHSDRPGTFRSADSLHPDQIPADEVGYYRDPLGRLERLHTGGHEIATVFGFRALW